MKKYVVCAVPRSKSMNGMVPVGIYTDKEKAIQAKNYCIEYGCKYVEIMSMPVDANPVEFPWTEVDED